MCTSKKKIARQVVASWIEKLQSSITAPHGLPEDILQHALEGYLSGQFTWPKLMTKARKFHQIVQKHVSDCTVRMVRRKNPPAAGVSILRLMAMPLRQSETLFGARIYTFTFLPEKLWFLQTIDPLFTTDHLHQRLVERASNRPDSLVQTHDSLSILWPALLELGQQRRRAGRPGNVTHFITPLDDGLIFGHLQRADYTTEVHESFAPTILDCENGHILETRLADTFRKGNERLFIIARTFVGADQLKPTQRRLKETLDGYILKHGVVLDCMRNWPRLAYDAEPPYGTHHRDLFTVPLPEKSNFKKAFDELDEITSSVDWLNEICRSKENIFRRR